MDYDALIKALVPLTSRVRTDVTAMKKNGAQLWTREALTDDMLKHHLNGGPARGVCPIKEGESVTMVGLLDLDAHKGESTWEDMTQAALAIMAELDARFMCPVAFRSSGGSGIHIYVMWETPQDAYSVRTELIAALAAVGYTNGTSGVNRKQVEVFPKQNAVALGGFGNQFILPLAGKSALLEPLFNLEPLEKGDAAAMVWPMSVPVPKHDAPARAVVAAGTYDGDVLAKALMAIPNTDAEGPDRDEWFRILCAFKEGGGDEAAGYTWSLQHSTHDDGKFALAWGSITVGKDGGVGPEYLMGVAERKGFVEHITSEFAIAPVVTASAGGPPDPGPLPAWQRDKLGRVESTVTTTVQAVRRPDVTGMRVAYDEFRDEITVAEYGDDGGQVWRPMTDADAVTIRMGLEGVGFKAAPKELTRDACVLVASENRYDSATEWLGSLKWDGVPRVETFLKTFMGCEDTPYTRAVSMYLWSALAGRVIQPGVKADMVPIYEGEQGIRKSSAIEAISPDPMFFVEIDLGEKEEDTVRKLRGALIGEIAELSGLHKKELEAIKKFVVRKVEKWVPKYKEFPSTFARRLVFIGTTNRTDILADDTGNRRWLPVHITRADVEGIVASRDQLWAEGAAIFSRAGVVWQDAESLAVEQHEGYTVEDSWDEAVFAWLDSSDEFAEDCVKRGDVPFSTAAVVAGALQIPAKDQGRLSSLRISAILKGLGYAQKTARLANKPTRAWVKVK